MVKSVKVPNSYFVKTAERDYTNPSHAFIREYLQNSKDAGASHIKFKLYKNQRGEVIFECYDNGCGMTVDTIHNKLMALGETDKGTDSTGGFGVAKILILLSQIDYYIHTHNIEVVGEGGSYDIDNTSNYIKGTHFIITLNSKILNLDHFETTIENEIIKSYLPNIKITLNDKVIKANLNVRTPIYEDEEITMYQRSVGNYWDLSRYVYVRVGGLFMFSIYIGDVCKKGVIVELKGYSVNYLTTNRDGLKYDKQQKLQSLIANLLVNPLSFNKHYETITKFKGENSRISPDLKRIKDRVNNLITTSKTATQETLKQMREEIKKGIDELEVTTNSEELRTFVHDKINEIENSISKNVALIEDCELKRYDIKYHYYVRKGKGTRSIPKDFHPGTMRKKWKKLLDSWAAIIGQIMKENNKETVSYDVGYTIEKDKGKGLASYTKHDDTRLFLLNPISYGDESTIPVKPKRKVEVVLYLIDLASHEFVHFLGYIHHNEEMSAIETQVRLKAYKNLDKYLEIFLT